MQVAGTGVEPGRLGLTVEVCAKYVPKSPSTLMLTQVKVSSRAVCKTVALMPPLTARAGAWRAAYPVPEPCAASARHPGENLWSAMPTARHHSRYDKRAGVP